MAKIVKKKTVGNRASLSRKKLEEMGFWTPDYMEALSENELKVCHNFIRNCGSERRAMLDALPEDIELRSDQVTKGVKAFFKRRKINNYIASELAHIGRRLEVTTERLISEMASIAFTDVAEFMVDGKLDIDQADDLSKKAIKSVKVHKINRLDGIEEEIVELKLHDKIQSLDRLFKHRGLYAADNAQKSANDLTDDELMAEIEVLRTKS